MSPSPPNSSQATRHSTGQSPEAQVTRGHACIMCRRRKLKCDGHHPCQNCTKSRVECVAPEIVPARRRKWKTDDLAARLRRCEELIAKNGLKIENDQADLVDVAKVTSKSGNLDWGSLERESNAVTNVVVSDRALKELQSGKLIVDGGQTRYVENSFWERINPEVREDSIHMQQQQLSSSDDLDHASPVSDYTSLIFGRLMFTNPLRSNHPPPVQIFRLWQTFLDNVNPLTKLIHTPTVQQMIIQATGDLDNISAPNEALMFAIYHIAIVSLDEQECQKMMGDTRLDMMAKYSMATQQALCNAKLLKSSSIVVLQALTLYLLSLRQYFDVDTLWVLCGVAMRIGKRMGLHNESATSTLFVLELELRRRLWWQLLTLEGHLSSLAGNLPASSLPPRMNKLLNVNDSDLTPNMREPPVEHNGVTEMLFCIIRGEAGKFMMEHIIFDDPQTDSIVAKIKAIDELEARLDQQYLRYCDPSVPLHVLSTLVVRVATSKMRLLVYAPHRPAQAVTRTPEEKFAAFLIALKMIEFDNQCHMSMQLLKGFMWHVRVFFQIEAFIFLLSELRLRTSGDQVDFAWRQVENCYGHHSEILKDTKNKLWFAVGNLCIKSWEERAKARRSHQGQSHILINPGFIRELYAQRGAKGLERSGGTGLDIGVPIQDFSTDISSTMQTGHENKSFGAWNDPTGNDFALSNYIPFDNNAAGSMDWEYWRTLFDDCGVPLFRS